MRVEICQRRFTSAGLKTIKSKLKALKLAPFKVKVRPVASPVNETEAGTYSFTVSCKYAPITEGCRSDLEKLIDALLSTFVFRNAI